MTSITNSASDFQPSEAGAHRSGRRASTAVVTVVPTPRFEALRQALLRASHFLSDARLAWATGGALMSPPVNTPSTR
jgi:hypothetical protein